MRFTKRKLPLEKAADLHSYLLTDAEDFQILGSPVYLHMPRNGKFVSVKEPLDFFLPEERVRLNQAGSQFFVTRAFRRAAELTAEGRALRRTLGWLRESEGMRLEPAPYEVSQALRDRLNSAWSKFRRVGDAIGVAGIESFFIPFLIDGALDALPLETRVRSRTEDFESYERALLQSSLVAFFLLHLSVLDPAILALHRERAFRASFVGTGPAIGEWPMEVKAIYDWVVAKFPDSESRLLLSTDLESAGAGSAALRKVLSRIRRFRDGTLAPPRSVRGVNGFVETGDLEGIEGSDAVAALAKEFLEVKDAA